jgi:hypothetical protein
MYNGDENPPNSYCEVRLKQSQLFLDKFKRNKLANPKIEN